MMLDSEGWCLGSFVIISAISLASADYLLLALEVFPDAGGAARASVRTGAHI